MSVAAPPRRRSARPQAEQPRDLPPEVAASADAAAEAALGAWRARVASWRPAEPAPEPEALPGTSEAARLYRLALPCAESAWAAQRSLGACVLARVLPTQGHPIWRVLSLRPDPYGRRLAVPLWSGPPGARVVAGLALWAPEPGWAAPSGLLAATPAARASGRGSPVQDLDAYLVCDPSEAWICRS